MAGGYRSPARDGLAAGQAFLTKACASAADALFRGQVPLHLALGLDDPPIANAHEVDAAHGALALRRAWATRYGSILSTAFMLG